MDARQPGKSSVAPNANVCPYCNNLILECDQIGKHLLRLHVEHCPQRLFRQQMFRNLNRPQPSADGQPSHARHGLPVQAAGLAAHGGRSASRSSMGGSTVAANQATSHGSIGAGTELGSGEPPDIDLELRLGRP